MNGDAIRRTLAVLSVGILAAAALASPASARPETSGPTGATGSAAALAYCSLEGWGDKDKNDSGHLTRAAEVLRVGPYAGCTGDYMIYDTNLLYYHCYAYNSYGNTWTHVRIAGTNISGWVWDNILDDLGSNVQC
ncbi:hypothetical protein [Micromonospora luteifusca]|uniref:hypothetical protein n=1 Tax=Micromonospora luteifusca TaxID=709860 RepID=UPI00339E80D2